MREKDFSGFIGETLDLASENAQALALYVAVIGGLTALGLILGLTDPDGSIAGFGFGFTVDYNDSLASTFYELAVAVVTIIAAYFLIAQLLQSRGRLKSRETRIWAYIGMSILSVLGLILGFLLLIVPGIILMVRWSAASGFLIGARSGVTESLGNSWEATRGHSWPIFFTGLVLFLGLAIFGAVLGGIAGVLGIDALTAIVSGAVEALANAIFIAMGIAVYCLVADDSEQTADVFA